VGTPFSYRQLFVLGDQSVFNRFRTPFTACNSANKGAVNSELTRNSAVDTAESFN
jgi:hypothetical protein